MFNAENIKTIQNIGIEAYQSSTSLTSSAKIGSVGFIVSGASTTYQTKKSTGWITISKEEFDKIIANRFLIFITTDKSLITKQRKEDLVKENSNYFVWDGSNWIVYNQETFNRHFVLAFQNLNKIANTILWGVEGQGDKDPSNLIDKLNLILDYKNKIKDSIKTQGGNPTDSLDSFSPAINNFAYAPYIPAFANESSINLVDHPGYFLSTLTSRDNRTPSITNKINTQGSWNTNHNMYYNGDLYATRVFNAVWNDYAEFFEKDENCKYYSVGDVVVLNPETNKYTTSNEENSKLVVGIITDNYGSIIGGNSNLLEENLKNFIPVSLAGRVKVNTSEKVEIGDLLISDKNGKAKATKDINNSFGCVIGKVLKVINENEALVLIMRA